MSVRKVGRYKERMTRLGPGILKDTDGEVCLDVKELCDVFGFPNTTECRERIGDLLQYFAETVYPKSPINRVKEGEPQ